MRCFIAMAIFLIYSFPLFGQVKLYGPGGPHTALQAAAAEFETQTGIKVEVVFGPHVNWRDRANVDATIIFGASEQSMDGILQAHKVRFNAKNVVPLFYRDAVLLVQKGNPNGYKNLHDFIVRDGRAVVNGGAGYSSTSGTGVWEDIIGRMGSIKLLQQFSRNIVLSTPNSGASRKAFVENSDVDGWITWIDWAMSNPELGTVVPLEPKALISRSMNIVVANDANDETQQFATFLQSAQAEVFFAQFGWYKERKKRFFFF
ncbi:MAG: substrate-binding domain-containing protein [Spirochaetia bacterium]